jgi:hypothetical protein
MDYVFENFKFLLSLFLVGLLLVISSCGAGVNNASEELSGDSYFRESGHDLSYITSHNELHRTIYPRVVAYAYNDAFILAAQIPNREHDKGSIASELNNGKENFDDLLKKADSILTHDPYYIKILSGKLNFWIIRNDTHELIGPLTSNEYLRARKKLNIPEDLKLDVKL